MTVQEWGSILATVLLLLVGVMAWRWPTQEPR